MEPLEKKRKIDVTFIREERTPYTPNTTYRLLQISNVKDMLQNKQVKQTILYKNTNAA